MKRWTKSELALLEKYKNSRLLGKAIVERLPGRSYYACIKKARSMGWFTPRRRRELVSLHLDLPRALYDELSLRARVAGVSVRRYSLNKLEKT